MAKKKKTGKREEGEKRREKKGLGQKILEKIREARKILGNQKTYMFGDIKRCQTGHVRWNFVDSESDVMKIAAFLFTLNCVGFVLLSYTDNDMTFPRGWIAPRVSSTSGSGRSSGDLDVELGVHSCRLDIGR